MNIKKETASLEERGLHGDSYFSVVFTDGTTITEKECNWSSFSIMDRVKYQGGTKTVLKSIHPVSKISIFHGPFSTELDVPAGYDVYQAIRGQATVLGSSGQNQIVGRVVGLINNGEVVEERVINILEQTVQGWKI
jgi:hypothetical protein